MGTSRSNGDKVTVKEMHTENCQEQHITCEIMTLSKLSHDCIPKLRELFITNIGVFVVCVVDLQLNTADNKCVCR